MKPITLTALATVSLILIAFPAFGASPHPLDVPAINFQGRIEVGDVGYSGWSKFTFLIGNEDFSSVYWGSWAGTTCTEGIYNVILGRDTAAPLTDAVFNHQDAYYLRVGFSTDGTNFETLSPDQEIVTIPFSVNADRLDGLDSPDSAIVGISDSQTLTNKTLGTGTVTTYFVVIPAADPGADVPEGYLWYDTANNSMKVHIGGGVWQEMTGAGGDSGIVDWVAGTGDDTHIAYWVSETRIDGEAAFTYNDATDKVTVTSAADTGEALQIVADSLTTGTALDVSSAAAGTATYKLATFTAATGQALVVTHTGGAGAGHESVLIDRNNNGRALTIEGDVTTQYLAYLTDQTTLTSGNILRLRAGNTTFDAGGSVLYVDAASNQGAGKGITVIQRSSGDGIYVSKSATAATGMGARFNQETDSGDGTLDDDQGGTVHIYNNQPNYALTIYSPTTLNPSRPLVAYRAASASFDQPLLELYPALGSEAPPLYLHPLTNAPDSVEGGPQLGMIYVNNTDKTLRFWNGATWLALTGSAGGSGTFATVALDNLSSVAINTSLLPLDDGITVDLGSAAFSFKDAYLDGTATLATVDINAGTIDGTTIATSDITVGAGKTLDVSAGTLTLANDQINGDKVEGGTIASITISQLAGAMDANSQAITNVNIDSGTIDGATINSSTIGLTTPAAAEFSTLTADIVALDSTGSAAAPAITWEADPNTGIFRPAADLLVFATGGVEKLRIYSTAGGTAANPLLQLSADANTGIYHPAAEEIAVSGNGTETIRFDALNYVGIGTGSAIDSKLHVETSGVNALKVEQGGAFEGIYIDQNGANSALRIDQDGYTGTSAPTDTAGGALHVGNLGNEGPAITAYSNHTRPMAPLAWLRAGTSFGDNTDQPVLCLQGRTAHSSPLYLVPQATGGKTQGATKSGEIFFDAIDGITDLLKYYNGTAWMTVATADFAEIMEAVEPHTEYEAGDVIVQSQVAMRVELSDRTYETSVVGVISDRSHEPNYSLPVNEHKIVVGLIGLVKCKVTGDGGPILPGDKLVTSPTPGYAMKADLTMARSWNIVGTAREPFDGEEGMIEIIVGK